MTDSIQQKYKADKLDADELAQLREDVNASTDELLGEQIENDWYTSAATPSPGYEAHVRSLYAAVARSLFGPVDSGRRDGTSVGWRIFRIVQKVAVVLLPVAIVAISMLYRENRSLASDAIVVSTGDGEQASVTLPDGSRVSINQNTRLTYVPDKFRGSERRVNMDGEGFYCVAHDKSRPFFVDADGLAVRVLGTKFNLKARDSEHTAELVLTEGSVAFTSLKLHQSATLKAGQKVVLDKLTGRMDVQNPESVDNDVAWKRKELVFRNTPLSLVFAQMRKQFHMDIVVDKRVDQRSLFTGTLSSVSLNDNLEIIDLSCDVRSSIIGKTVFVENSTNSRP